MNELDIALIAIKMFAETHPRPIEVNRTQAAQMLNKSRVTIQSMIDRGVLKLNDNGMIPITEIDRLAYPKVA